MTEEENLKGGRVLASGGFGCLFDPALQCANPTSKKQTRHNHKQKQVTKLMTTKHAAEEYKLIQLFKQEIQAHVPHYTRYFLLDGFTLCQPAPLSAEDLSNFDTKCKALTKTRKNRSQFTAENVNSQLDQLGALNMPFGGICVDDYVSQILAAGSGSGTGPLLVKLNEGLIRLLQEGILPMNAANIYHCDVKDSNMLVDPHAQGTEEHAIYPRLIDWGLSAICRKPSVPKQLSNRPFQFNVPFSSILFNEEFTIRYAAFLNAHVGMVVPRYEMREFVVNFMFVWSKMRGSGHIETINDIIHTFTAPYILDISPEESVPDSAEGHKLVEDVVEHCFTYHYIIDYLTDILDTFGQDLQTYFNQVYLANIDVWGFVMVYEKIYVLLSKDPATSNRLRLFAQVKHLIFYFLFGHAAEPIPVDELIPFLRQLNELFI